MQEDTDSNIYKNSITLQLGVTLVAVIAVSSVAIGLGSFLVYRWSVYMFNAFM